MGDRNKAGRRQAAADMAHLTHKLPKGVSTLDVPDSKAALATSSRTMAAKPEKGDQQGELKIKFTDCAKQPDSTQQFLKDPAPGKQEQILTTVEFAMAYGETQNFSQPIFSGFFSFLCTFKKEKTRQDIAKLDTICTNCYIDQDIEPKRADQVIVNLKKSIEKAMQIQYKRMCLRQDNFFKLDGEIKSIFHSKETTTAVLRLRLQDSAIHQSTMQAKSHFAELGMSSSQQPKSKEAESKSFQAYPDQHLDQIIFPEPFQITLKMPIKVWEQEDQRLSTMISTMQSEQHRLMRALEKQQEQMQREMQSRSESGNAAYKAAKETSRKIQDMHSLKNFVSSQSRRVARTFTFQEAGLLQQFLQNYKMKLDKLLKALSMDEECKQECASKEMKDFGKRECQARCRLNSERSLSQAERMMILYSMIYVERENLHPDVREHLWMRASGAHQMMKSYANYPGPSQQRTQDYYQTLEDMPCPPNPSVGTIKADQSRISFDLEVTKKSHRVRIPGQLTKEKMQNRFAQVMMAYHKRNGAFVYNQSQSEILIRILEVVFSKDIAFWLYTALNETILPLNFYTNTLYPQAFLDYTKTVVKQWDSNFFERSGDAINFFCLKSYFSLFTNLVIEPQNTSIGQSEMAYFMLDLLFLLGDPKQSTTLLDDPINDGPFNVNETLPRLDRVKKQAYDENPERMVRIDRTSQLLVAMSITVADFVKQFYLRATMKQSEKERMVTTLSGFEEIVRVSIIDKSSLLTLILSIEIFFFSKKNNEKLYNDFCELVTMNNKQKREEQAEKFIKNNNIFGEALDKTRDFTDRRFEKNPSIKTNIDTDKRYLDKTKFLMKFSCFDGYMQYVDKNWDTECQGIDPVHFKVLCDDAERSDHKSAMTKFYDNYTKQEMLVSQIDCGGNTKQPVCLYDFTVKNLQHDCLNFSTRHMQNEGIDSYIDDNYITRMQAQPRHHQVSKAGNPSSPPYQPLHNPQEELEESKDANESRLMIQKFSRGAPSTIPQYLPMYRGIHLCSSMFTKIFRQSIRQNSKDLAEIVDSITSNNLEYSMKRVELEDNRLFNQKLLQMLYSQPLIDGKIRYEGSYSYGRAMHQLRQFYVRVVDGNDTQRFINRWETKRIAYIKQIEEIAQRRNGQDYETENERKESLLGVLKDFSDLSFKHWPERTQLSRIRVYPEGKKKKKMSTVQQHCQKITYEQLMTQDNVQSLLTFDERASTASLMRDPQDMRSQMNDLDDNYGRTSSKPSLVRTGSVASSNYATVEGVPISEPQMGQTKGVPTASAVSSTGSDYEPALEELPPREEEVKKPEASFIDQALAQVIVDTGTEERLKLEQEFDRNILATSQKQLDPNYSIIGAVVEGEVEITAGLGTRQQRISSSASSDGNQAGGRPMSRQAEKPIKRKSKAQEAAARVSRQALQSENNKAATEEESSLWQT